jgi:hypothetical protein
MSPAACRLASSVRHRALARDSPAARSRSAPRARIASGSGTPPAAAVIRSKTVNAAEAGIRWPVQDHRGE